jgi:hypothetical protein
VVVVVVVVVFWPPAPFWLPLPLLEVEVEVVVVELVVEVFLSLPVVVVFLSLPAPWLLSFCPASACPGSKETSATPATPPSRRRAFRRDWPTAIARASSSSHSPIDPSALIVSRLIPDPRMQPMQSTPRSAMDVQATHVYSTVACSPCQAPYNPTVLFPETDETVQRIGAV